jgi:hypothetical protein
MGTFESRNHHHGRVSAATATVRLQRHTIVVDNCCLCCGVRLTRLLAAGAVVRAETGALDSTRLRRLPGCHRSLEISFAFAFDEHRRTVAYSHTHASAKHITPLAAAAAATSRSLPPPPPPRRGTQDACVSAYGASAAGDTDAPDPGTQARRGRANPSSIIASDAHRESATRTHAGGRSETPTDTAHRHTQAQTQTQMHTTHAPHTPAIHDHPHPTTGHGEHVHKQIARYFFLGAGYLLKSILLQCRYRCKLVWQMWSRRGPVAEHVEGLVDLGCPLGGLL